MKEILKTAGIVMRAVLACAALAICVQAQQNVNPADPGASELTPPPAYTPEPKDAPPAADTQAQLDALARFKARAEEKFAADRKAYNTMVTPTYNFHYGQKIHLHRAIFNRRVRALFSRAHTPARSTAAHAIRRPTVSGGRRYTRKPSARRSTAPA